METRWSERAPSCIKNSTMVEEPEQSNESRDSRTSKGIWPNSRNSAVLIPRASHHRRGGRPFRAGEERAKRAKFFPLSPPFFPMAEAALENRQSYGALVFMATEHGLWPQRGEKSKKAKVLRRRSPPHFFELPASCRHSANVEGRGVAGLARTAGSESRGELKRRGQRGAANCGVGDRRRTANWGPATALHSSPGAISRTRSSWYTACHSLQPGFTSPLCQARYRERVKSIAAPELRLSRI